MTLQLNQKAHDVEAMRNLWGDNLAWWVNCLGIERFWAYQGPDLDFARSRRDALLTALIGTTDAEGK